MNRRVYSTETGRLCPDCQNPTNDCQCKNSQTVLGDGKVRIQRETKGRKGKGVTLITGLPLTADELKKLAKQLKQLCGTGGAVKNGVIEIQGDQREVLKKALIDKGYDAKIAGG